MTVGMDFPPFIYGQYGQPLVVDDMFHGSNGILKYVYNIIVFVRMEPVMPNGHRTHILVMEVVDSGSS